MKQFIFILLWWISGLAAAQETNCVNGIDDDGDGKIDCADGDCFGEAHCPTVFDQAPAVCEDSFGSGDATVDLTTYEAAITGGNPFTVSWYKSINAGGNLVQPINTPETHVASNNDIIYALVSNGTNQDTASVTFTVNDLPSTINQTPVVCEDVFGSGQSIINLPTLEPSISAGAGLIFSWYLDAALTVPVADPGNTTVASGAQFYVLVDNGNCSDVATVDYTVNSLDDPSFTYAGTPYCPTDTDPVVTITGNTGGTFSALAGLAIDTGLGQIDLSASTPGNHTVTYTTGGICPTSSTFDIEILDDQAPVAQPADNITCDAFTATWNSVFGAISYEVDVAEDIDFTTIVDGYNATSTSNVFLNVTGLNATQTYYYRVRAITSCGTSINSDTIMAEVMDIPVAVANLVASNPDCDGFTVSWDAVAYASSYLLEVSKDGFVTTDISQSIPSTSLALAGLDQGTIYQYRVTPQNVCGAGSASTGSYQTNDVPAIPTNVVVSQIVCDGAMLTWDEVMEAEEYYVEVLNVANNSGVGYLVSNDTLSLNGLLAATNYSYRIAPINTCGTGDTTAIMTFLTDSLPSAPVDILLEVEHNQVTVGWESIVNADTYSVEIATDDLFSSTVSTIVSNSADTTITALTPLTTYYLRIFATNTCGNGLYSDTLSFTTPQNPLVIDSLALVDFYTATDGPNWTDNTNWLSGEVNTWHGVTVTDNRVVQLELSNNQLSGSFPIAMSDLTGLEYADLRGNALSGILGDWISNFSEATDYLLIGDNQLSGTVTHVDYTLGNIDLTNNTLTFEDFVSVVDSLPNLTYAPQSIVGTTTNTFRNVEDSYTLSIDIDESLTDNQYVWYRDGVAIDTTTAGEYVMDTVVVSDEGVYVCEIINSAAPDLTLVSNPMTVNVQAKPHSLIFTPVADVSFGTTPFVLNSSASSGLPILFEVVEGDSLVDIQGDMVTTLGIGQVTVRATQPGDDFYEAATPITRQFTINQGSQTIAFTAISDQDIAHTDSVGLAISASSGLPIDFTIDGPAELDGNILWLLDTGTVTVTAAQVGNELYQPAFPVSQSFLVFTSDTVPPVTEPPVDSTVEYSVTVQSSSSGNVPTVVASLHQASGSSFSTEQEKTLDSGSGVFSDVAGGFYSILLTPTDAAYFPTYLGGRLTLSQASILGVTKDTTLSIALLSIPDTTAQQGVAVGGILAVEGTTGGRSNGSAMANIPVYLVSTTGQSIVGYGSSNNEGKFYFPNIPPGDYYFLADYEGVDMRDNQVTVNDKALALSVEVGKFIRTVDIKEEEVKPPPTLITSIGSASDITLSVYPNPVVDRLTLEVPTGWMGSRVVITNTAGQQVASQQLINRQNSVFLQALPTGLYYVQIQNKHQSHFMKILKQ